ALQLINEKVSVMTTRKGITDTFVYDEAAVRERFGIGPGGVPDYLGLKGDTSDNIPGVPGVGDKTAAELLGKYGTLDGIYEHIDEIAKPKLKESLLANKEQAYFSRDLAILQPDIPIDVNFSALEHESRDKSRIKTLFQRLEFKSLISRLNDPDIFAEDTLFSTAAVSPTAAVPDYEISSIEDDPDGFAKRSAAGASAFEISETDFSARVFVACDKGAVFAGGPEEDAVRKYLCDAKRAKACHNLKEKIHLLGRYDIKVAGVVLDTMLAAYLLDTGRKSYELEDEMLYYLNETLPADGQVSAATAAAGILKLKKIMEPALEAGALNKLLGEVELPLSYVLADMEAYGATVDVTVLKGLSRGMGKDLARLEEDIYEDAGGEFNISSPRQLAEVLFAKLKLEPVKKGKTGFSTDASVLAKLAGEHRIVKRILSYRELAKLKSTYLDALPALVDTRTGRLHTYFNQVGTSTGRLASERPNLQNIPVKGEWGLKIRAAFIPGGPDRELLIADYSQIELRVLASLAEDKAMLKSFAEGQDIHNATASEVLGIWPEDVNADQRRLAKEVNFGLMYGMSGFGLADRLEIDQADAEAFITAYFERYPQVRQFIDGVIAKVREDGFVETVLGRRRIIREINSSDFMVRRQGERFAVNAVIQGSAADIIKVAMVAIDRDIKGKGLASRMFLQVHDELLFDAARSEKMELYDLVKRNMETAYPLRAPLAVNIGFAQNWGEVEK
ncbi:MAG: DNA polymerase I, partial [Actinomycetota bacterium]